MRIRTGKPCVVKYVAFKSDLTHHQVFTLHHVKTNAQVIVKGPQRINPSKPISEESSSITGIHDSDVQGAPSWQDVATEWREFLEGCVLHGYNAKRFDVPLLRCGGAWVNVGWLQRDGFGSCILLLPFHDVHGMLVCLSPATGTPCNGQVPAHGVAHFL